VTFSTDSQVMYYVDTLKKHTHNDTYTLAEVGDMEDVRSVSGSGGGWARDCDW
jgi:hypothetical protein